MKFYAEGGSLQTQFFGEYFFVVKGNKISAN